ncbi:MAG: 5-(carboxyamino)imidazole ribonucleotide mutase [Thermoplasmata archaeon]
MDVLVILGSKSDADRGKKAVAVLEEFDVQTRLIVASAHRTPDRLRKAVEDSDAQIFIAMAGMSAALPGTIAALTIRPVIGVPLSGKLNLDAVLAVTQMPPGVPVAAVSLDGAVNAALLAVEILALSQPTLREQLETYREGMREAIEKDSGSLGG